MGRRNGLHTAHARGQVTQALTHLREAALEGALQARHALAQSALSLGQPANILPDLGHVLLKPANIRLCHRFLPSRGFCDFWQAFTYPTTRVTASRMAQGLTSV